jgi:hypothetical protein
MRSQARDLPRLRAGVLASGQNSPTVRRRPIEACSRERARLADPRGRLGQQSQQEAVPQPAAGADHRGHLPGIERDRDLPAGAELRHTRATQAINRGMRLDAIAAPLIYARIANRVVADEYAAVTAKIDAVYGQTPSCPPTTRPPA